MHLATITGLYDFMFREYNPVHGRWISPDPAGIAAVSLVNPQSWNRYAYVGNSPCDHTDPFGLADCMFNVAVNGQDLVTREEWSSAWSELNRLLALGNLGANLASAREADFTVDLQNNPTGFGELWGVDWDTLGKNSAWFGAPNNSAAVWVNNTEMAAAGMNIGTALGRVMAHEFGHWALQMVHTYPNPGPLEVGLMSQGLSPTLMTGMATLVPDQISILRSRCQSLHPPTPPGAKPRGGGSGGGVGAGGSSGGVFPIFLCNPEYCVVIWVGGGGGGPVPPRPRSNQ